jgi:uncharacterized protein YuzE
VIDRPLLSIIIGKEGEEEEFVEVQPGINVEFDKHRQVIGVEIMRASEILKDIIEPVRQKIKG